MRGRSIDQLGNSTKNKQKTINPRFAADIAGNIPERATNKQSILFGSLHRCKPGTLQAGRISKKDCLNCTVKQSFKKEPLKKTRPVLVKSRGFDTGKVQGYVPIWLRTRFDQGAAGARRRPRARVGAPPPGPKRMKPQAPARRAVAMDTEGYTCYLPTCSCGCFVPKPPLEALRASTQRRPKLSSRKPGGSSLEEINLGVGPVEPWKNKPC